MFYRLIIELSYFAIKIGEMVSNIWSRIGCRSHKQIIPSDKKIQYCTHLNLGIVFPFMFV